MRQLDSTPARVCLVRLSALGDVTHVLPIVHTLRKAWPQTELSWVIGKREAELVAGMRGVELLTLDKAAGVAGYRALADRLRGRSFDVLLLMQVSMRAHLVSRLVKAPLRIGFDSVRSRDLHRLFVNRRIPFVDRQHVVDALFGFLEQLGIFTRVMDWSVPIPDVDHRWAAEQLPGDQPTLMISPAASTTVRNWFAEDYATIADHAFRCYGMRVLLCGGPAPLERELGAAIERYAKIARPLNLIGKDTLKRLLALMARSTVVLSPDSGPAHMAAITDTPVIGLYALSDSRRSGPYKSLAFCADAYESAALRHLGQPSEALRWGQRVEHLDAMRCVTRELVEGRLAAVMATSAVGGAEPSMRTFRTSITAS